MYATTQTVPWIIFFGYLCKLSDEASDPFDGSFKSFQVSLNLLLVILEMLLSQALLPPSSCIYPLVFTWAYTVFTWIFVYGNIWNWPYPFFHLVLNPLERPWWLTVAALFCGSLGIICIFGFAYVTFRIRQTLADYYSRDLYSNYYKRPIQDFN